MTRQKPFSFELNRFRTLNTRDTPVTCEQDELPLLINYMPIGTSLYTVPGIGDVEQKAGEDETVWAYAGAAVTLNDVRIPTIYNGLVYKCTTGGNSGATEPNWDTTPGNTTADGTAVWTGYSLTIHRMFVFNDEGVDKLIMLTVGGAIYSATGTVQTRLCLPGTCSTNTRFAQWKNTHLLVLDTTAGYSTWDGAAAPPLTFDANYKGRALAVFATRVWIVQTATLGDSSRTIAYTAPDTYLPAGFTALGSGSVIDTFASTRSQIYALVPTQEYLYVVGDHGIHIITGVAILDTGSTSFQLLDAIQAIGTKYPDTIQVIGGVMFIFNDVGVYAVQGYQWELLSSYMDGSMPAIDTTVATPFAAIAKIYNKLVYCIALNYTDRYDGNAKQALWCYYEERWFIVFYGDSYPITCLVSWPSSTDMKLYGSHGQSILQLFTGSTVMKRLFRTKSDNFGMPLHDKQILKAGAVASSSVGVIQIDASVTVIGSYSRGTGAISLIAESTQWYQDDETLVSWVNDLSEIVLWSYPFTDLFGAASIEARGKRVQFEFTEQSSSQYVLTGVLVEGTLGAEW